jgi:hypothetical protein
MTLLSATGPPGLRTSFRSGSTTTYALACNGNARPSAAPATGPASLVGRQVIEDHVDLFALILLDDPVHEVAELQPATAFVMLADDLAGADVERGEQGRCRVACNHAIGQSSPAHSVA